jgi:hypothetical protein
MTTYDVSKVQCIGHLLHLDRLGLIRLLPKKPGKSENCPRLCLASRRPDPSILSRACPN